MLVNLAGSTRAAMLSGRPFHSVNAAAPRETSMVKQTLLLYSLKDLSTVPMQFMRNIAWFGSWF